jgi:ferrous-iron efflux pump FieF
MTETLLSQSGGDRPSALEVPIGVPPERAARMMRNATYAAVAAATGLIAAKFVAWIATGSVAILTSLVDSLLDVAASVFNMIAVRHALTPADREHRFGHGKAEAMAGVAQAAFIFGSLAFVIYEAIGHLVQPETVQHGALGVAVMLSSIAVTLVLVLYQRRVVRLTRSVAIRADSLHYRGDLLMNASVIVALVLSSEFGVWFADPLFALAIVAVILKSAFDIMRRSIDQIMDREFPEDLRAKIKAIVLAHPAALAMHDLRTRLSGTQAFIQLHLVMDRNMSLMQAHAISDEIEAAIRAAFPGAEVIIHEDPEGLDEHHPELAAR